MQGASSDVFIREAMRLMHERGYRLGNLDATIIAEVGDRLQAPISLAYAEIFMFSHMHSAGAAVHGDEGCMEHLQSALATDMVVECRAEA